MKKSGTARGCRNGVHDLSSSRSYLAPMTLHSGCVLRGSTFCSSHAYYGLCRPSSVCNSSFTMLPSLVSTQEHDQGLNQR